MTKKTRLPTLYHILCNTEYEMKPDTRNMPKFARSKLVLDLVTLPLFTSK